MKRGRLKIVDLPIRVDEIEEDVQRTLDGELEWGISVGGTGQASGHRFAKGSAALRKEVERDVARVEDDDGIAIAPTVKHTHDTKFGEWLAVDDGWLLVSDEWVAGIVSSQIPGHPEDANMHLRGVLDGIDPDNVWQIGFAGRNLSNGGSKGVLYGNHVDQDPEIGEELMHTPLNELGIEHLHEGLTVKSYFAAGTGYVEVYDDEFTSYQMVEYCSQHVLEHIESEDEEESSADESDEADADAKAGGDEAEVQACENCPQESDSVRETRVGEGEYLDLCLACRNYYYEKGEIPDKGGVSA